MKDLYRGSLVRFCNESPDLLAKTMAKWDRDTEQHRLADSEPAQLWSEKKLKDFIEKRANNNPRAFRFWVRTLADDTLIGGVGLWVNLWNHEDAWLGISIGERDYWSKGYGTDIMRLALQYAFVELNLRRVSLGLHAYNERALKTYQKVGFKLEGRSRGEGFRDGVRFDTLWMGILREEWLASAAGEEAK
jgi:RimJ/RimL family protein N-acetyltransferase